jgi:hypothetical protein
MTLGWFEGNRTKVATSQMESRRLLLPPEASA